jgi:plasmid stabilization system protein ParE
MTKELRWTSEAENTFEAIVNYLEKIGQKKKFQILFKQPLGLLILFLNNP